MRNYFERKDALTLEEARKRTFETHGENIILLKFRGAHGKSLFECSICHHKWEADSWSVWNGNGCFECSKIALRNKFNLKIEDVRDYIESKNCKLLSTEYINTRKNLIIQFPCGHVNEMCFGSFKRNPSCKKCAVIKLNSSRKYSMERINKLMNDLNLTFIEFPNGYVNRN